MKYWEVSSSLARSLSWEAVYQRANAWTHKDVSLENVNGKAQIFKSTKRIQYQTTPWYSSCEALFRLMCFESSQYARLCDSLQEIQKHVKTTVYFFCNGQISLQPHVDGHQLCLVRSQPLKSPRLSRSCFGKCQQFFSLLYEGRGGGDYRGGRSQAPSPQSGEKLTTAQDKHQRWHPLGWLTPRACVGACQPGLWPGSVDTAAQHPSGLPESAGSPWWKVCISTYGAHCGDEKVAIHQTPPLPTNVAITSQATTS